MGCQKFQAEIIPNEPATDNAGEGNKKTHPINYLEI